MSAIGRRIMSACCSSAIGIYCISACIRQIKIKRVIKQLIGGHVEELCHFEDKISRRDALAGLDLTDATSSLVGQRRGQFADRHTVLGAECAHFLTKPSHEASFTGLDFCTMTLI